MAASRSVRLVLSLLAVAAVACGQAGGRGAKGGAAATRGSRAGVAASPTGSPAPDPLTDLGLGGAYGRVDPRPGVDLIPIHVPAFIFGYAFTDPAIQSGTTTLVGGVRATKRLVVTALPSARGTAAIDFLELSPPGHLWGEQMIPAQRALFRSFAGDPSLGDALVIVDDVQVLKAPDPLPMTAYRWERQAVETYARCGIPDRLIEGCTDAFYMAAEMILVGQSGAGRGY